MSAARVDTVLAIDTPEHLAFKVRVAGPTRRMFAWMIDLLARGFIMASLALGISLVFGGVDLGGLGVGLLFLGYFLIDWGYFFASELLTGGRSPGKIVMKLRVVRNNGLPLTWRESLLRNLVRAVDLDIGLVVALHFPPLGPPVMLLDPKFRRLGDMLAGTIVVVEEATALSSRRAVEPDENLVAELPGTLPFDRDDLEAIELFVHRPQISQARRDELARIVAPEYARRLARTLPKNPAKFVASVWARAQDPKRRIEQ